MHEQPELVQTHRRTRHTPRVRRCVLMIRRQHQRHGGSFFVGGYPTDLGPHVLKLAWDEAAFGIEYTRVGSVLVSMDCLNVDAQKGVGNVTDGEPETE